MHVAPILDLTEGMCSDSSHVLLWYKQITKS